MLRRSSVADDLRQGDVCAVKDLPLWNLAKSSTVSGGDASGLLIPSFNRGQMSNGQPLVAIVSQCCDLENPRSRTGIAVAPVMRVPASPGDRRFEGIVSSATINAEGAYAYVNLFPLGAVAGQEAVVDFSAMLTIAPHAMASELLREGRILALEDEAREAMRLKLGYMFGRDPSSAVAPGEN